MNLIINLQIIDCSKRHGSLLALSRLFLTFFVQYFKREIYLALKERDSEKTGHLLENHARHFTSSLHARDMGNPLSSLLKATDLTF